MCSHPLWSANQFNSNLNIQYVQITVIKPSIMPFHQIFLCSHSTYTMKMTSLTCCYEDLLRRMRYSSTQEKLKRNEKASPSFDPYAYTRVCSWFSFMTSYKSHQCEARLSQIYLCPTGTRRNELTRVISSPTFGETHSYAVNIITRFWIIAPCTIETKYRSEVNCL